MIRGTQIIYVPSHADGPDHPDAEPGFVTSGGHEGFVFAFCRYWSKTYPGELRTKLNSERTAVEDLVVQDTMSQALVKKALEEYCR